MRLQFLGANRQVTGSRHCLEAEGTRVLVDYGMFQEREFQDRNWEDPPVAADGIDAVCLTHAHVDHCGMLPRLVKQGYRGPIITTSATAELVDIVLRDSAHIQVEDVEFKIQRHRKEGRQGRYPEEPLFTLDDVEQTLKLLETAAYNQPTRIGDRLSVTFFDAGHILGSAMIQCDVTNNGQSRRIVFSGDVGQWDRPIVCDPSVFTQADYVLMESTYGDRDHQQAGDVQQQLVDVIAATVKRGGNVVIPVFAIERTQELLYYVSRILHERRIPQVDVFLDSPMAAKATKVFGAHRELFDAETNARIAGGDQPFRFPGLKVIGATEESKALNDRRKPAVIMATSGMCVGGRIKHHLRHNITRPESTIVFVGYQGRGTLGRQIVDGAREVRIHGAAWPVRAKVVEIHGFSGHSDRAGLLRWLGHFQTPPKQLFLVHGESESSQALAEQVRREKGWQVTVPEYRQVVELP